MENKDQQDLIIAFRGGDEKAFSGIYDLFYGPIYYFIQRILNNTAEAEEITADTFLKLWNIRSNFETIQNIKAFLYITARNASLNRLKQKKEHARRHQEIGYILMRDMDGPTQQDEIKAEVLSRVLREIDNLPLQCKKIFKLSVVEGLKNTQIAGEMGLTLQTVKNHKARGLKILKQSLSAGEWQFMVILQLFIFI